MYKKKYCQEVESYLNRLIAYFRNINFLEFLDVYCSIYK